MHPPRNWGVLYYGGTSEITMTYPLWAVIIGREYYGEDFSTLKLFTNAEDAESYVDHGIGG